jgi:CHAT domain-containing protein
LFNSEKNRFLVQDFNLSYDYSLPIWLLNKKYKTSNQQHKFVAFAPNYPSKNEVAFTRADLKDLIFAKKEAAQVAKLFNGTTFLNQKATKNTFLKVKENFGIFHFSMHSLLFEDDFNQSCLVFSNNERLYFSELYKMNFPAQMVVLSACDTGNGVLKSGEGIMSISRALTYAGVNSTVMSLWQVPDKETSEIMISFYKNLKKGETKDAALANAKKEFLSKNRMKQHPFYWAGFVVNGDVSPITNTTSNWIWFAFAGVIIALFGYIFLKKLF